MTSLVRCVLIDDQFKRKIINRFPLRFNTYKTEKVVVNTYIEELLVLEDFHLSILTLIIMTKCEKGVFFLKSKTAHFLTRL